MRSVIYSMGVSLDGYIAGPGGDIAPPPPDAEVWRSVADEIRAVGVHLMGRRLADSLFERVEDLGLRRMHLEPTPAAVAAGLADAFSSASAGVGRGERTRGSDTRQIRGCRVTVGGRRRPVDLFLTA